jgi:hypothetical protein
MKLFLNLNFLKNYLKSCKDNYFADEFNECQKCKKKFIIKKIITIKLIFLYNILQI